MNIINNVKRIYGINSGGALLSVSRDVYCVCIHIAILFCILGIGLVSLCKVLTIIKKGENVSAPVHPHVLIIVKTHENRVEHILENITNDLTAKNYF